MKSNLSSSSSAASTGGTSRSAIAATSSGSNDSPATAAACEHKPDSSETATELLVDRSDHSVRERLRAIARAPRVARTPSRVARPERAARCRTGCRRSRDTASRARRHRRSGPISRPASSEVSGRELQPAARPCPCGALECGEQARGGVAVGDRREQRSSEPAKQVGQQLHRRGVGPVDVVEGEQHRLAPRQPLEHASDRDSGAGSARRHRPGASRHASPRGRDGKTDASSRSTSSSRARSTAGSSEPR